MRPPGVDVQSEPITRLDTALTFGGAASRASLCCHLKIHISSVCLSTKAREAAMHLQQAALFGLQSSQQAAQQLMAVLLPPTLQEMNGTSSQPQALIQDAPSQQNCRLSCLADIARA